MDMLQDIVITGLLASLPMAVLAGRFARDSAGPGNKESLDITQYGGGQSGVKLKRRIDDHHSM